MTYAYSLQQNLQQGSYEPHFLLKVQTLMYTNTCVSRMISPYISHAEFMVLFMLKKEKYTILFNQILTLTSVPSIYYTEMTDYKEI